MKKIHHRIVTTPVGTQPPTALGVLWSHWCRCSPRPPRCCLLSARTRVSRSCPEKKTWLAGEKSIIYGILYMGIWPKYRLHLTSRIPWDEKVYLPIHEWLILMGLMYGNYSIWPNGIIFHQPGFPRNKRISLTKLTTIWGPKNSCEVAII